MSLYTRTLLLLILPTLLIVLANGAITSLGSQVSMHLCLRNETVAVQLSTRRDQADVSCTCQASTVDDPAFREDYVHTPGIGSHKLHTDAKNWNDARKVCNEEMGHLAIINSLAEEAILSNMLKKAVGSIKGGLNTEEALVGIHDLYKEGEWVTIFGESLYATGYSHWSPTYWNGQPDNYGGNQNCGAVLDQGGMDDVFCHDKFAFFCELPITC